MCVIILHEDEEGGRRPGNGKEGREAAMEGRAGAGLPAFVAWRPACSAVGWREWTRAWRPGGLAARAAGLAAGVLFGSAAP